jgi:hypothetical protein
MYLPRMTLKAFEARLRGCTDDSNAEFANIGAHVFDTGAASLSTLLLHTKQLFAELYARQYHACNRPIGC